MGALRTEASARQISKMRRGLTTFYSKDCLQGGSKEPNISRWSSGGRGLSRTTF